MSAAKTAGGAKPPTPAGSQRPGSSSIGGAKGGAKGTPGKGKTADKSNAEGLVAAGMLLKEEDKEPLPTFPIDWHAYGVVVEGAWDEMHLDAVALRALLAAENVPEWTICEADAMAMAEEIATDSDSSLGGLVRTAKDADAAGDGTGTWLRPELVAQLFAARMELDRGRAHRAEIKRRAAAAAAATEAVDVAKGVAVAATEKLTSARAECAAAKDAHAALVARFKTQEPPAKEPEEPTEGRGRASTIASSNPSKEILSQASQSKPLDLKAKAAAAKPGAKVKPGTKAEEPVLLTQADVDNSKAAAAAADAAVMAASRELRAANLKLKELEEVRKAAQAAMEAPFAATWVYWCSNFGADAQSLADTVVAGCPLRALIHLKESVETDSSKTQSPETALGASTNGTAATPALIEGFKGLVASATLDMPARHIALLECTWAKPTSAVLELGETGAVGPTAQSTVSRDGTTTDGKKPGSRPGTATKAGDKKPAKGGDKKQDKKGGGEEVGPDGLGTVAPAAALRAATRTVADRAIAYEGYRARMKVVEVPAASDDVDMCHYQQLLQNVPPADVTVPLMLHCMLEQVVRGDCASLDLREEETARAADAAAAYLDAAFGRLGLFETPRSVPIPAGDTAPAADSGAGSTDSRPVGDNPLHPADTFPLGSGQVVGNEAVEGDVTSALQRSGETPREIEIAALEPSDGLSATGETKPRVVQNEDGVHKAPENKSALSVNQQGNGTEQRSGMEQQNRTEQRNGTQQDRALSNTGLRAGLSHGLGLTGVKGPGPTVVREGDSTAGLLAGRTELIDVAAVERSMRDLLELPGRNRSSMPPEPLLDQTARNVDSTALRAHCADGATLADVQRFQRMSALASMSADPVTSASLFGRRHVETLSADSLAQEWCKSALSLPGVRASYHSAEDSLLVILDNGNDGNATSNLAIVRYMPFADFYQAETAAHPGNAYTLEPAESSVSTRRSSVAAGSAGLLCARSSEKSRGGRAEVTAYVDGHVLALRSSRMEPTGEERQKKESLGVALLTMPAGSPGLEAGSAGTAGSAQSLAPTVSETISVTLPGVVIDTTAQPTAERSDGESNRVDEAEGLVANSGVTSDLTGSMEDGSVISVTCVRTGATGNGNGNGSETWIAKNGMGPERTSETEQNSIRQQRVQIADASGAVVELTSAGMVTMFDAAELERKRKWDEERERTEAVRVAERRRAEAERKEAAEAERKAAEQAEAESKAAKERPGTSKGKPSGAKPSTPSKADAAAKKEAKAGKASKDSPTAEKPVALEASPEEEPLAESKKGSNLGQQAAESAGTARAELGDSEEALTEAARSVTSFGAVVRILRGGGMQVLYPNGNIAERNAPGGTESHWVVTNFAGERKAIYDLVPEPQADTSGPEKLAETSAAAAVAAPPAEPAEKKASGKEERAKTPVDKKAGGKSKDGKAKDASKTVPPEAKPVAEKTEPEKPAEPVVPQVTLAQEKKVQTPRVETLPSVKVVEVTDPETGFRVTTREDLTMMVISRDGTQRVFHTTDGTRISSGTDGANWQVGKEGFPTVRGKAGAGISVETRGGWRATWVESDGAIALRKQGLGSLSILGGLVTFVAEKGGEGSVMGDSVNGQYVFDLLSGASEFPCPDAAPLKIDGQGNITGVDQGPSGCHVALSRVFCIREGGHGYELLDEGVFEKYRHRKQRDGNCTVLTEPVIGSEENAVAHIFLTRPQPNPQTPSGPPRPTRTTRPATASRAVPALALPSKSLLTPGQDRFEQSIHDVTNPSDDVSQEGWLWADPAPLPIPRIAARPPKPPIPAAPPPVVLFRQILELPPLDEPKLAAIQGVLSRFDAWQKERDERKASYEMEEDPRSPEEVAKADALAARVANARAEIPADPERARAEEGSARGEADRACAEAEHAAAILREEEERARADAERRVAEDLATRAEATAAKARAFEEKRGHVVPCIHDEKDPIETTGPCRPIPRTTLRYFDSEEGIQAALAYKLQNAPEPKHATISQRPPQPGSPTRRALRAPSPLRQTRVAPLEEPRGYSREVSQINFRPEDKRPDRDSFRDENGNESGSSWGGTRSESAGTRSGTAETRSSSAGTVTDAENVTGSVDSAGTRSGTAGSAQSFGTVDTTLGTVGSGDIVPPEMNGKKAGKSSGGKLTGSFGPEDLVKDGSRKGLGGTHSTLFDVTGRPRQTPVSPPKSILRNEASAAPNERFLEVEASVKRVIRTSSTVAETRNLLAGAGEALTRSGPLSPIKQFTLTPEEVSFGRVNVGLTARQSLVLRNVHSDVGRFRLRPLEAPFSASHKLGPVAPGMAVKIDLAYAPTAAGETHKTHLEIVTELNRFTIPLSGSAS